MNIHPDIKRALKENKPIVALESTIITHGLPHPENVDMAREVEGIVREAGAVPATIAIIEGVITVGLHDATLDALALHPAPLKVSTRDIGYAISQKKTGGTTVAATMQIAEQVGIHVFATGGIGGVHRGAELSFDVSSDLEALGNCRVAVVCAGAKAILDLGKTLEVLETKGVEVVGYKTDTLPAFYTRSSKHAVPHRLDTPEDVAALMHAKWSFGLPGGVVVANPIPESHAADEALIEKAIAKALQDMKHQGIIGKDQTPYLLERVRQLTEGKSVDANVALVRHNAAVAADIAVAYAKQHPLNDA